MEYTIKHEYANSLGMKLLQIYHPTNQILEVSKNLYWNATKTEPITIVDSRKDDYIVSKRLIKTKATNKQSINKMTKIEKR